MQTRSEAHLAALKVGEDVFVADEDAIDLNLHRENFLLNLLQCVRQPLKQL